MRPREVVIARDETASIPGGDFHGMFLAVGMRWRGFQLIER